MLRELRDEHLGLTQLSIISHLQESVKSFFDNLIIPVTITINQYDKKKNLGIPFSTFGAVPFEECEAALDNAGLKSMPFNAVLYRLFGFLDWKKTIRIGVHDFMTGWTCVFSEDALAEKLGCCGKTVRKALHMLTENHILKREKVGKCFRYRIILFEAVIDALKEHPPETVKIAYLKKDGLEDLNAEMKHTTRNNSSVMSETDSQNTEECSDNQEYSRFKQEDPSPPGPSLIPGDADSMPKSGGGRRNLKNSQNTEDDLPWNDPADKLEANEKPRRPVASPGHGTDSLPAAAPGPGREKKKEASQREKLPDDAVFLEESPRISKLSYVDASQRFLSMILSLADHFADDEVEFTPDRLRRKRASQFHAPLSDLFHAPSVVDLYPDPHARLDACAEVLRVWVNLVKSRDNPAFSVNFIMTEPGLKALIDARKQVFGSDKDWQEVEMDPTIANLWEEKHGENWREKRAKEISAQRIS